MGGLVVISLEGPFDMLKTIINYESSTKTCLTSQTIVSRNNQHLTDDGKHRTCYLKLQYFGRHFSDFKTPFIFCVTSFLTQAMQLATIGILSTFLLLEIQPKNFFLAVNFLFNAIFL